MVGKKYYRKEPPNYRAECVVMADVDGWIMARFDGCQPFVLRLETFLAEFTPAVNPPNNVIQADATTAAPGAGLELNPTNHGAA